jgi:uncharacterized protein (TIGR02145 family)
VWYLADTRESSNPQTYTVKLMGDGRIWMVQDLKFGDKCNKTTFSGSTYNQQGKVSAAFPSHYGDCRNNTYSGAGYLYDWAAAINKAGAYYGSGSDVGCLGSASGNGNSCQGVCPVGWHIPTTTEFTDANTKFASYYGCSNNSCWNAASAWLGLPSGQCDSKGSISWDGSTGNYSTSTYIDANSHYYMYQGSLFNIARGYSKRDGLIVRCVRNY